MQVYNILYNAFCHRTSFQLTFKIVFFLIIIFNGLSDRTESTIILIILYLNLQKSVSKNYYSLASWLARWAYELFRVLDVIHLHHHHTVNACILLLFNIKYLVFVILRLFFSDSQETFRPLNRRYDNSFGGKYLYIIPTYLPTVTWGA